MSVSSLPNNLAPNIGSAGSVSPAPSKSSGAQTSSVLGSDFKSLLSSLSTGVGAKSETAPASALKFSNHAVERMQSRGMSFPPEVMTRIENAAQRASQKGAKETLVLADDSALIVDLKKNMVVTVMDKNMMKENVFTNIDSTVFA